MSATSFQVLLAALAFVGSWFFSGVETGVVSCDRIRLRYLSERGSWRARLLLGILVHPDRVVAATLVGTNLANILLTAIVTALAIQSWGIEGARVVVPIVIVLVIIFAEILPKALYRMHADTLVLWSAIPLAAAHWILGPATRLLQRFARLLVRLVPGTAERRAESLTRAELAHFLEKSGHAGSAGRRWFRAVLGISERTVASVLVPLADLPSVTHAETVALAATRLRVLGGSFLLVRRSPGGEPLGTVGVHDLLDAPPDRHVGDLARPAPIVRADLRIEELLPEIQSGATPLAFVEREGGGVVGIVTHEAIAFAIVGTIEEAPAGSPAGSPLTTRPAAG